MSLIDVAKDYMEKRKILRNGHKLYEQKNPVDLMSEIDLVNELDYLVNRDWKKDELDDRTIELLKELFTYGEKNQMRI